MCTYELRVPSTSTHLGLSTNDNQWSISFGASSVTRTRMDHEPFIGMLIEHQTAFKGSYTHVSIVAVLYIQST